MLDYVIRNARLPASQDTLDIGFAAGRIAALEPGLVSAFATRS